MDRFRTPPPDWLARPSGSLRYVAYSRLYATGCAVHLTLPDALQAGWLVPNLACWVGVALLAFNGCLLGWCLAALGLAWPLLLLGDQLTQSVYLLGCAMAAIGCWIGPRTTRGPRLDRGFALAVRLLTVGVYTAAAFHKLNRDFLDPEVSCATGGVHVLAENWSLPVLANPALDPLWPPFFLGAELALVVLFCVRPGAALGLGLLLHLPLTLVFAPAFAFVMIPGWSQFLTEAELRHVGATMRRHARAIVAAGLLLGGASIALYYRDHWVAYPFWFLKELSLWTALAWVAAAWWRRPAGVFGWGSAWREGWPPRRGILAVVLAVAWGANVATPYTGLQLHHTGAMLSNLRIDDGCWNHLLIPPSARLHDPYVRVKEVEVGGDVRGAPELEALIASRLWSRRDLYRARAAWCRRGAAPVGAILEVAGREIVVEDLCRDWPLGRPLLPGFRAFQRNLSPQCPQPCIH